MKYYMLIILTLLAGCGGDSGGGSDKKTGYTWTNLAPYGGFVSAVQFDPNNSNIVWLSGDDSSGLYLRASPGSDWILQKNVPEDWSAYTISIDPANSNIIYAPNHFGRGLLKTTDGGASWTITGAGLPTALAEKRVEDFAIDPTDSTIVYAACEGGLYRSSNSGATFSQVVSAQFTESSHFRALEVYDGTNDRVFTGNQKGGVYMSIDSGVTWTIVAPASPTGIPVSDLAFSGNALYTAYSFGFLGKSETLIPAGYTIINDASGPGDIESGMWTRILVVPGATAAQDKLYIGTTAKPASTKWGFFVSTDGGNTYTKKDTIDGSSVFSMTLDPADASHIIIGTVNADVYETGDAGDSWAKVSAKVLATDSFGFYEDPSDSKHLIFSSTASAPGTSRVFETIDKGATWTHVTALDFEDFMSLYIDRNNPLIIMAGTFSNGLYRSANGSGGPWTQILTPNVICGIHKVVPDSVNNTHLYAVTAEIGRTSDPTDIGLYFSDNTGQTWTRKLSFGIMDVKAHPVNADEAVVFSGDVLATTDNFTAVANSLGLAVFAPGKIFTTGAFDPADPSILIVGTAEGDLFRTNNYNPAGGCTWEAIPNLAQDVLIADIEIIGKNIYACCFMGDTNVLPTSTPGIMTSRDRGGSWKFLDRNMYPSRLTFKMQKSHTVSKRLYVGMWGGGFLRLDDI